MKVAGFMTSFFNTILDFLKKNALLLSLMAFTFFFFVARYPFYHYFSLPGLIEQDGTAYYDFVFQQESGLWPKFDVVTAGYPLFIMLVHAFCWKSICLIYAQSALNYLSFLLLIIVVARFYKPIVVYLVSCAAILFCTANNVLWFETCNFRDSVYLSILVFICSFLLLTLKIRSASKKHISATILSILSFYVIIVRPSSIFMIVIIGLLLISFLLRKEYKYALSSAVPAVLLFLIYALYNFCTLGVFSVLPQGATKITLEKYFSSSFYDIAANEVINKTISLLPRRHPYSIITFSDQYYDVYRSYLITRSGSYMFMDSTDQVKLAIRLEYLEKVNIDSLFEANSSTLGKEFMSWYKGDRYEFIKIWNDNINYYINSSNGFFLRKILSSIYAFHHHVVTRDHLFYYSELKWRYEDTYIIPGYTLSFIIAPYRTVEQMKFMYREFFGIRKAWDDYNNTLKLMYNDPVFKLFDLYSIRIHDKIHGNILWVLLFYVALIIALIKTIKYLLRDTESFFILLLCLMNLGSMIIFCTTTFPMNRYVFTTEFMFYLVPALLPILFGRRFQISDSNY